MTESPPFVRLDASDNVVTATRALEAGTVIEDLRTAVLIPSGHKVATRAIKKGGEIRKYAQLIGYASADIAPGDHIHTQNTAFRNTDMDYEYGTDLRPVEMVPEGQRDSFLGYRRENGRVGVRNHVLVLPLDDISNACAEAVANNIKGTLAVPHPYGRLPPSSGPR